MTLIFSNWVEKQIRLAPNDICAFVFNLYEERGAFSVEIVGAKAFSSDNPDWACREDFVPSPRRRWSIPMELSGSNWESCLAALQLDIRELLEMGKIGRLVSAEAVALGFVDGDLHVLKP